MFDTLYLTLDTIKRIISMSEKIQWEENAKKKYELMLSKIPIFHREITKQVVDEAAPINAQNRGSGQVEEEDIVKAFMCEAPKVFYSLMVRLMDEVGFDHEKFSKE